MANLYTGSINTNGNYVNLSTLTGVTFTEGTTYAIQIQNVAWLREGTEGKGFLFNKDKGYNWTCKGDDLYIRTTLSPAIVNIAENSGFFLNKSGGGGGSTAKNTAIIQKDNVIRTVNSKVQGKVPDIINYTNTGGVTVTADYIASGFGSGKYLELPNAFSPNNLSWEMVFEFTTGELSSYQGILTTKGSSDGITPFYMNNDNFVTHMSSNGTSWDLASAEIITSAQANTTYRMKAEYTGSAYNWYLYNGISWDLVKTLNISTPIFSGLNYVIGNNRSTSSTNGIFKGNINLNECYIKINDSLWWEAVTKNNWQDL